MKTGTYSKGIGGHHSATMKTDEYLTPPEILASLGEFDLDPCGPVNRPWSTAKTHYTKQDNGLVQSWFGRVWLNPPYGRSICEWMNLMALHGCGISLVFARTETRFFHDHIWNAADSILFLDGRLHFYNVDGTRNKANAGAPSVLIAYGRDNVERLGDSGLKGKHLLVNSIPILVVGVSPTWISIVTIAVKQFGDKELQPIYDMVERIAPDKVANNRYWKEKIRQKMQVIRRKILK